MRSTKRGRIGVVVVLGAIVMLGCSGDTTGPAGRPPLYWRLQLNHHAVTLATVTGYDTVQLTATPLDVNGNPIATTARPVFTTSDTSITIDSTGFVRVHRAGSNQLKITVIARLTIGGAAGSTLADTAMVNVVNFSPSASVPKMDTLLFGPPAGDSARRAVIDLNGNAGTQVFVTNSSTPVAKTSSGGTIPNVAVSYKSSDPLIAAFTISGLGKVTLTPVSPGVVLLTAEATVYGKSLTDSIWYTVGYPLTLLYDYGAGQQFVIQTSPFPTTNNISLGTLVIGQGGRVIWGNSWQDAVSPRSLDIAFDDTTGVAGLSQQATVGGILFPAGSGGNIPPFGPAVEGPACSGLCYSISYDSSTSKVRVFPNIGTWHWHSDLQGIAGSVTVVSNDSLRHH